MLSIDIIDSYGQYSSPRHPHVLVLLRHEVQLQAALVGDQLVLGQLGLPLLLGGSERVPEHLVSQPVILNSVLKDNNKVIIKIKL